MTLKAIDNDASFSETRIGLQKFALDADKAKIFDAKLREICRQLHGENDWSYEHVTRVSNDPAITREGKTMTIDLGKMQSPETMMAVVETFGVHTVALPEEIDEDFYNVLMEMDKDPARRQEYLDSIRPRISPAALEATRTRLDEAIEHAKSLAGKGKVYGDEQWQKPVMTPLDKNVKITKSDGTSVTFTDNIPFVKSYILHKCPSYFMRDHFDKMFEKPKTDPLH